LVSETELVLWLFDLDSVPDDVDEPVLWLWYVVVVLWLWD
jgi:hypothetical protein